MAANGVDDDVMKAVRQAARIKLRSRVGEVGPVRNEKAWLREAEDSILAAYGEQLASLVGEPHDTLLRAAQGLPAPSQPVCVDDMTYDEELDLIRGQRA